MKKIALLIATLITLTGCQVQESNVVRLAAHDSFVISEELIEQFESETGYELEILRLGDTGSLTNQLILTKNAPVADAFFGIDNTFLARADSEGIFALHGSEGFLAGNIQPITHSDVCFNFDIGWFEREQIAPPTTWRDLVNEEYQDLVVITNPNFSSPGLAFLATTHGAFATSAEVEAFWLALRDNGVKVSGSWEDAYFGDFTRYGGNRPIVLSYASSPSAEVGEDGNPGTQALLTECFRQIEFAGVIAGSANEPGAFALVDFLLSPEFQASVPEAMYVYPAVPGIDIPDVWSQSAKPALSVIGEGSLVSDTDRERWLDGWSEIFGD